MRTQKKNNFYNTTKAEKMYWRNLHIFLDYLKTKTPTDGFTERLEQRVLEIRRDTEWRDDYMTLEMKMDEKYEQGVSKLKVWITKGNPAKGIEQGIGQ